MSGSGWGLLADLIAVVVKVLAADPRDVSLVDLVGDIARIHTQRLSGGLWDRVHVAGYAATGAMLTDSLRLPGR